MYDTERTEHAMAKNDSDPEPLEGGDPLLARLERHGELRVARVVGAESKGADGAAYAAAPHSVAKGQDTLPPNPAVILDITDPGSALPPAETTIETFPGHTNTTVSTPLARATRLRNGVVGAAIALAIVVLSLAVIRKLHGRTTDERVQVTSASATPSTTASEFLPSVNTSPTSPREQPTTTDSIEPASSATSAKQPPHVSSNGIAHPSSTAASSAVPRLPSSAAPHDVPPAPHPSAPVNPDIELMHHDLHSNGATQ